MNRLFVDISSSDTLRRGPSMVRVVPIIRLLAMAGVAAWAASSCASAAPGSSAASTHSAQTLIQLMTQMVVQKEPVVTRSPTANAPRGVTPSATALPSNTPGGTISVIPTVALISPTSHPLRATYPGATPTTNATSLLTQTLTDRCNAAYFVGSVPPILDNSEVKAGATFVKTWVIRNAGTCTWYPSYFLFYYSGAHMEGPDIVDFPEIIPPNKNLFLSLTLVAPRQPGKYTGRWYLRDPDFHQFGIGPEYSDPLLVKITVIA
jgi:hypothetical protein